MITEVKNIYLRTYPQAIKRRELREKQKTIEKIEVISVTT